MRQTVSMRLLLIRHAETADNVDRVVGSRLPGPPLTSTGREQARGLAARLPPTSAVIHSSHARRAVETAETVAEALGVPHAQVEGLHEIDAGDLEGRPYADALEGYAGTMQTWWTEPGTRIPGGESGSEFMDRFDRAVAAVLDGSPDDGLAVVVSHEAAICVWAANVASNLDAEFSRTHGITNTGVVELEGSPQDGWTVTSWDGSPVPP